MSIERVRLNGLQSRSLELRSGKSAPTKPEDIGQRARFYKSLAMNAAMASMALEGMSGGRGTQEMMDAQTAQIRATRREAVLSGFNLEGFDLVVKDRIAILKAKAEEDRLKELEKEGDYKLLRAEFPGVFPEPDSEHQAMMGETIGDIVNFGTHAFKKDDAGGFEPVRRGWAHIPAPHVKTP